MVIFFETNNGIQKIESGEIPPVSRSEYRIVEFYKENIVYVLKTNEEYPFQSEENFERKIRRNDVFFQNSYQNYPKLKRESFAFVEKDFYYWKNYFTNLGLTEKQAICIYLYVVGYTTPEIGQKLNISKQAAQKNVNLAIKKLKKIFGTLDNTYDWQEVYEDMITLK